MQQLRELRSQHPTLKLIAHSVTDDEKIINKLSGFGFSKYVLIGNDIKYTFDMSPKGWYLGLQFEF
jgi:DNA-binding NarL/FixJ family response regulator